MKVPFLFYLIGVVPDDSVSEQQQLSMSSANSTDQEASTTGTSVSWSKYVIILASILIVACLLISAVLFRKQAQTAISPWKTGLSAQLQRALVIQGKIFVGFETTEAKYSIASGVKLILVRKCHN